MRLTENQMQNLVGQILYCCAEGEILNELGIKVVQDVDFNSIKRNGYKEIASAIQGFLNDVQEDASIYNEPLFNC